MENYGVLQMKNMTCLHTASVVSSKYPKDYAVQFDSNEDVKTMFLSQNIWHSPLYLILYHVLAINIALASPFETNWTAELSRHLDDTTQAVWKCVVGFFWRWHTWPSQVFVVLALVTILPLCETPEWFCGFENVTRAYWWEVKLEKFQVWLNYPFKFLVSVEIKATNQSTGQRKRCKREKEEQEVEEEEQEMN